jgi:hypothetical protein
MLDYDVRWLLVIQFRLTAILSSALTINQLSDSSFVMYQQHCFENPRNVITNLMINNSYSHDQEISVQKSFDEIMQLHIRRMFTEDSKLRFKHTRMHRVVVAGSLFLLHVVLELECLANKFSCISSSQ